MASDKVFIKHITKILLGFESYCFSYRFSSPLSIKYDRYKKNDEEIVKNVFQILDKAECFIVRKVSISIEKYGYIRVNYLYEGHSGYYNFDFVFYLIYLTDTDEIILCGNIEQDVHELFEDIIIDKIMPEWAKDLKLIK